MRCSSYVAARVQGQLNILRSLVVLTAAICIAASSDAGMPEEECNTVFFRANNAYREERYDDAIQDYERLIDAGFQSANIFYNLGNAYLRSGDRGRAILCYERAFRMCPRDADIRSNLSFARTLVEGGTERNGGASWYGRVLFFLDDLLSVDEMTLLVSSLYLAAMVMFTLGVLFRSWRRAFHYSAVVLCFILAAVLPSFINGIYESEFQRRAVIMVEEAAVRFEPSDDATVHFKLYEGAVIRVIRSQDGWHQVRRSDGKMGWLKGDVFTVI